MHIIWSDLFLKQHLGRCCFPTVTSLLLLLLVGCKTLRLKYDVVHALEPSFVKWIPGAVLFISFKFSQG